MPLYYGYTEHAGHLAQPGFILGKNAIFRRKKHGGIFWKSERSLLYRRIAGKNTCGPRGRISDVLPWGSTALKVRSPTVSP